MEFESSVWQIAIIAFVAGAMIGALAYRLLSPSVQQAGKVKTDLEQTRDELEKYKINVGQHFDKTSELIEDLTKDYVKVYRHLADGAQALGDNRTLSNLLEKHQVGTSISTDNTKGEEAKHSVSDTAVPADCPVDASAKI